MTAWHILTRVGVTDTYDPDLSVDTPRLSCALDRPGDLSAVRNDIEEVIQKTFAVTLSPFAHDLLVLAISVYSADLQVSREYAADQWTRRFVLHVPVANPSGWTRGKARIESLLQYLTGDHWEILFRTTSRTSAPGKKCSASKVRTVCLFSGGLDSLVGAIDLLEAGETTVLVGHHGAGMGFFYQNRLLDKVSPQYGKLVIPCMMYVQPSKAFDAGERTMRSRSFLFLSLGVAVAALLGKDTSLVVAENGLISLNVPLTKPRIGALSTRTTHPYFIQEFCNMLADMSVPIDIKLPCRFSTKGEMLLNTANKAFLSQTAPLSMSCSHTEAARWEGVAPGAHCGYCVPCIIRRAAMDAAGISGDKYLVDLAKSPPASSSVKGRDLRAFQIAIERLRGAPPSRFLRDVLGTGQLPPVDAQQYADVYRRGVNEVCALLKLKAIP